MANVVIASDDQLCQSAKAWFKKNKNCLEGIENFDKLKDGDWLYIIAHDNELGDAEGLIGALQKQDFPVEQFQVLLIVCSAHSHQYTKKLATPAEELANFFRRTVYASKSIVYGNWDDNYGAYFQGDYYAVEPDTDLESLFKKFSI